MRTSDYIGIIADDLTGANDTALQFFMRGCETRVSFGEDAAVDENFKTEVFALSTESRNVDCETAHFRIENALENVIKNCSFEYIYKKIDSVLRGNIAVEVMTLSRGLGYDAALICPAFPSEGRTTVGGFHLLKGVPLQRTEVSRDPSCPVVESNIINILKSRMPKEFEDSLALISLDIVMKGAGPILAKLNELISAGKKIIVADAVSTTDVEQIALAYTKTNYKVLPCGSAGLAQALSKIWHPETGEEKSTSVEIPDLPKFIVSGSATDMTAAQIKRLQENDNIENTYFVAIKPENIFSDDYEDVSERILNNLIKQNTVIVHSSELVENNDELLAFLMEHEITRDVFISRICDYLSAVTRTVLSRRESVLITVGGETSYKCCRAVGVNNLRIIDTVAPAIPLGISSNGQYIVTKSGNLGNQNTLVEIVKYFEQDK